MTNSDAHMLLSQDLQHITAVIRNYNHSVTKTNTNIYTNYNIFLVCVCVTVDYFSLY